MAEYLEDIWKSRYFWTHLAMADLRSKWRRSFFGILWSIIQPLGLTVLLAIVFGRIFKTDIGTYAPYILFGNYRLGLYLVDRSRRFACLRSSRRLHQAVSASSCDLYAANCARQSDRHGDGELKPGRLGVGRLAGEFRMVLACGAVDFSNRRIDLLADGDVPCLYRHPIPRSSARTGLDPAGAVVRFADLF